MKQVHKEQQSEKQPATKRAGKNLNILVLFALIMVCLGTSDASRGVFSGIFEEALQLSKPQVSAIVTVSYMGNLLFVLLGGRLADRFDHKKFFISLLVIWITAQALFAVTESYPLLMIGMFFSMGASTLMNTMMNILSPLFFGAMAGMFVNILFFTQGIGTSAHQMITGSIADGYEDYQLVCLGLGIVGVLCLLWILRTHFPRKREEQQPAGTGMADGSAEPDSRQLTGAIQPARFRMSVAVGMGLVFGFYFVAEHGILNWWSMYCIQGLSLSNTTASLSVSLFFTTLTIGRLVFSPLVQKLGARRSILLMGGLGTAVYVAGVLAGISGIWLVGASGALFSIVYPTGVLFLQELFPKKSIATATGLVLSIATMFDVGFNAVFGNLLEAAGFDVCRIIFPAAMGLFFLLFLIVTRRKVRGSLNQWNLPKV